MEPTQKKKLTIRSTKAPSAMTMAPKEVRIAQAAPSIQLASSESSGSYTGAGIGIILVTLAFCTIVALQLMEKSDLSNEGTVSSVSSTTTEKVNAPKPIEKNAADLPAAKPE